MSRALPNYFPNILQRGIIQYSITEEKKEGEEVKESEEVKEGEEKKTYTTTQSLPRMPNIYQRRRASNYQ